MNLRELREKSKLSQKYVAEQLGITTTYLYMLENGLRNPSDNIKEKLAKLYKVKISDIFLSIKITKC